MIFVTGGVRSGKSHYAEERAIELHEARSESNLHYIATSRIYDNEMAKRVERHQQGRIQSGANWRVWEKTRNIDEQFVHFHNGDTLLLDCVTTLISNEFFVFSETNTEMWRDATFQGNVEKKLKALFANLATAPWDVIIVSNEVSYDLPTGDEDTELYKRLLGRIHQYIVSHAKEAIVIECGIPCWKKGEKQWLES